MPATLAGETIQFYNTNGTAAGTISFIDDGTFTQTKAGSVTGLGTYAFTQYSPTVAIMQQNFTDPNDAGAVSYAEMTYTSATGGRVFYGYYKNPTYGSNPNDIHLGTFEVK